MADIIQTHTTSLTNEGYSRLTLENPYDGIAYCQIYAYPSSTGAYFSYTRYDINTITLQPGETRTISVNLPKSIRKEWFGEFCGGIVAITVSAYKTADYLDAFLWGVESVTSYYFSHQINGTFGLALTGFNDYIEFSGLPTTKFVRGNNSIRTYFAITVLDTTRTIENINIFTTYNLVEMDNNPSITDQSAFYNRPYYKCMVTLNNVFSPNVKFDISINYSYESTTTQFKTNSIKINQAIPLQDYQEPMVFAEVTSPMTGAGDCEIAVSGRYQATLDNGSAKNNIYVYYSVAQIGGFNNATTYLDVAKSDDGLFSGTINLSGLNYNEPYYIEVTARDLLGSIGSTRIELTNRPVFDWNHENFNFNIPVYHQEEIIIQEDKAIHGIYDGMIKKVFTPQDSAGNTVIGYDNYNNESGNTLIYGNSIDIMAHNGVTINGKTLVGQTDKVLWSGSNVMGTTASITLSDAISQQANGIILVFSLFRNNATEDVSINSFFISKKEVELLPGAPHTFWMAINSGFSNIGAKYLYIYDDHIEGNSNNNMMGTNSGISYNNASYVLRYVLGV